jgi:hypothetical protein
LLYIQSPVVNSVSGAVVCANQPSRASRKAKCFNARGLLGFKKAADPQADSATAMAVLQTKGFCMQQQTKQQAVLTLLARSGELLGSGG